uniref:Possible tRNA binding domain-containing protein n=1 Tax=Arundo donax TaxID=35708 RepID=A0A0A8Y321_ARUDO
MGLQDKDIGTVKEELGIEREQVLSNFIKTMKKLYGYLHNIAGKEIEAILPRLKEIEMAPLSKSMDEDLAEAAKEVEEKRRAVNEATVDPKFLQKYAIDGDDNEIEKALQNGKVSASGVISVKSSKTKPDKKEKHKEMGKSKRKGTDGRSESKKEEILKVLINMGTETIGPGAFELTWKMPSHVSQNHEDVFFVWKNKGRSRDGVNEANFGL